MRKMISYPIDSASPGWPDNPTFSAEPFSSMENGDEANTYLLHLFNHFGTHMDAPNHYNAVGAKMCEFPIDTFLFEKPLLLDIPKNRGEKILPEDFQPYACELAACDLLLIRTGFESRRESDPEEYVWHGPAVGKDACKYLIENFGKNIKALAVDFLSLASPSDTVDGNEAHRYLCANYYEDNIFIIEDTRLSCINKEKLVRAAAVPLYMKGVDSSPVTAWVEEEE